MNITILVIFYIFSLIVATIELLSKKKLYLLYILLAIIFALLAAYRGDYVPDTVPYIRIYESFNTNIFDLQGGYYEHGFVFFSKLEKLIFGNDYRLYFFIITLLNISIIFIAINNYYTENKIGWSGKTKNKLLVIPLIMYISFYGFYFNFIVLRVGIACSFILYSWTVIYKNKIMALIALILAFFFHFSTIFALLAYPFVLKKKKIPQFYQYLWLFIIGVIYFSGIGHYTSLFFVKMLGIVFSKYSFYIDNLTLATGGYSVRFIINYVIAFCLTYLNITDIKYDRFLNVFITGLTILSLLSGLLLVERVTDFYLLVSFLLISAALQYFKTWIDKLALIASISLVYLFFVMRIVNKEF